MKHIYLLLTLLCNIAVPRLSAQGGGPATDIAPNFILNDIDGVQHDMYAQLDQGKTVIIDFWTSWCPPCYDAFPHLSALWAAHGPDGDNTIVLYGMEMDNGTSFEHQVRDNYNLQYPIFNVGHLLHPDWNLNGYPSYGVICPDRSWTLLEGMISSSSTLMSYVNTCQPASTLTHDARAHDYLGEQDHCQSEAFEPVIRIQNRGTQLMTSAAIDVWVNGTFHYTYDWSGSLAQYYVSDSIFMPTISITTPTINAEFIITDVNGSADEHPADNNLEVTLGASLPGTAVTLDLQTDEFNWAVAYALYDDTGMVIDTSDVPMNTNILQTWILEDGTCYRFLITNYMGQGMGNQGYYKLKDSEGNVFAEGIHFGDAAEHTFFIDLTADLLENVSSDALSIYPVPTHGPLFFSGERAADIRTVEVFDALGRSVMQASMNGTIPMINLDGASNGIYHVHPIYKDGSRAVPFRLVLDK